VSYPQGWSGGSGVGTVVGMRGWWRDLKDLVLPAECGGCGMPRAVLCPECRAVLTGNAPRRVRPAPEPVGLPAVHAAAPYADAVRAVLLAHKERGALALAGPLGAALAGSVRAGLRAAQTRGQGPWEGPGEGLAGRDGGRSAEGVAEAEVGLPGGDGAASVRPGGECRGRWGDEVPRGVSGAVVPGAPGGLPGSVGKGLAWPGGGRGECDAVGIAARAVGGAGDGAAEGVVLLVPVPSSRTAVAARGHDPARRIALAAAAELRRGGVPARVLSVLRQRRGVADQAGLNSRQRLENLEGALAVAPGGARLLADGPVVLVDDLMTTGASLTEAARAVRMARADPAETGTASVTYEGALPGAYGDVASPVYTGEARESRGERMARTAGSAEVSGTRRPAGRGSAASNGIGDVICAAVVAATPDAFEINRN